MKKRKIGLIALVLVFLFSSMAFAKDKALKDGVLKVATNSTFPPYEYVEDGKITGIDMDIMEELGKRLGYKVEISDMEFNTILASIETSKVQVGIAGLTVTPERAKSVNFTQSYAKSVQLVILPLDSNIKSLDDLKDKKIGTQLGTTGDIYAKDDFGEDKVQSFDKHADAILALKSKKIDAVMIDELTAESFLKANKDLKKLDTPYAEEEYAIAVDKNNKALLDELNSGLSSMKEDGTLDKIIAKYLLDEESTGKSAGLINEIKRNLIDGNLWKYLVEGLKITLIVTFFALIIGFALGLLLSVIKLMHQDLNPSWSSFSGIALNILNGLANFYISFIRGTPAMIQLLIMFNIILVSVKDLKLVAILTFGLNSAAYMSEIFRGGFKAVDKGEIEAARALGLTYGQSFSKIILPQSIRISLPALANETITLFKETSIAGAIGLVELTRGANIIISNTFSAIIPYLATALIYLFFVFLLERLFKILERKYNHDRVK